MNTVSQETPATPVVQHRHPLLDIVPINFRTFDEWLKRWKIAKYQPEFLGLLHCFAEEENYILLCAEGVSFVLEIADGYSGINFSKPEERDSGEKIYRDRKAIAQKAFQVLCLKFFRGGTENHPLPHWWWMLKDEALFQKVLWFLRPRERYQPRNYRFQDQEDLVHPHNLFAKFLDEFPKLGWEFASLHHRYEDCWPDEDTRARMVATRPQFIEIIVEMRRLSWLSAQELDDASINKLTELALGEKLSLPPKLDGGMEDTYRKSETLEEACLGGSVAAKMLLLYRVAQKERKRLAALYEVEEQRRALNKRAEKLKKQ